MPLNTLGIVNALLTSDNYREYLINQMNEVEDNFLQNCLQKLDGIENMLQLYLIFGEATQNTTNFIYSNNTNAIRKNNFLKPAIVMQKNCARNTDFNADQFHDRLAKHNVVAIDVNPLPLPSEVYRNNGVNIGGFQIEYLEHRVLQLVQLINAKNITKVKAICRYQEETIKAQADRFIEMLNPLIPNVPINYIENENLSNKAGGLDREKYFIFIDQNPNN